MKVRGILYILFMVCLMAGCQDDFEEGFSGEGGMTEGMVTFRFGVENAAEIYTRSEATEAEEAIENVLLVVTDADDKVTKNAYFESLSGGNSVRMYLSAADETVYAFCNLPEETRTEIQTEIETDADPYTLAKLQEKSMTIQTEDGANPSSGFVMSGKETLTRGTDGSFPADGYTVYVDRLAAKLQFRVYFDPIYDDRDKFVVTGMYLYNIPKGSYLLEHEQMSVSTGAMEQFLDAGKDYVSAYDGTNNGDDYYFNFSNEKNASGSTDGTTEGSGYRIDYEIKPNTNTGVSNASEYYEAMFYQFENRRGAVYDDYKNKRGGDNWTGERKDWLLDNGETKWNDLASLRGITGSADDKPFEGGDLFEKYRQINKRMLAHYFERDETKQGYTDTHTGFPGASYLVVEGVYQTINAVGNYEASNVRYYVYLGSDNYADFNVRRNHNYIYEIKIYTEEKYDTRVYSKDAGNLAIYYDNAILDAHFNVLQTLLYSQTNWTARVVDPDKTPWLEISTSPSYKPRKAGDTNPDSDVAQFSLSGDGGLNYIYVHTDEFIPKINSPRENPWYATTPNLGGGDRVHMGVKTRKGQIVIESGTAEPVYIDVEQYAAQMVILHIEQDVNNLMKEVLDTFYIEQVMEKKNMAWGFEKYWSLGLDQLISKGQWDGLKNTRELYHMALWDDESDVKAYYPDGIPSDIALGYAIGKNRDRNGNGKIDAEEIVWYLPAANELQAIYGHTRPLDPDEAGDFYMDWLNRKTVYLPYEFGGPFHSSTPSSSDAYGITSGFSYFVNMYNGEKEIGQRSRYYNVICARRHNAWKGDNDGEVNGDMDVDDEWGDGNEVVVPR